MSTIKKFLAYVFSIEGLIHIVMLMVAFDRNVAVGIVCSVSLEGQRNRQVIRWHFLVSVGRVPRAGRSDSNFGVDDFVGQGHQHVGGVLVAGRRSQAADG